MKWGASNKFEKLRHVSRLHQLWATYIVVSPDSISKSEYHELKEAGFPLNDSLHLPLRAYALGKEEAQVRPSMRKSLDVTMRPIGFTDQDYVNVSIHEQRLASVVKSLLTSELEGNYSLLKGGTVDLRSVVVKCLEELKVIKNSAYISSIVNKEGVYHKSLGADSYIVSTGAIHDLKQVKDLPERNLYDLIFLPEDMAKSVGSPTVKPAGPEGARKEAASKPAAAGSLLGAPAAGNVPGPGRPAGAEDGDDLVQCPYDGGEACERAGGNGSKSHKKDGVIMKRHAEAMTAGDKPPTEEGEKELVQQEIRDTVAYDTIAHPHSKVLRALKNSDISIATPVGSSTTETSGTSEVYLVSFIGGGRGLAKPDIQLPKRVLDNEASATGAGTVPVGRNVGREVASYGAAMLHGQVDLVPPTAARSYEGRNMSVQQWKEGFTEGGAAVGRLRGDVKNFTKAMLEEVPAARKEAVTRKLKQLAVVTMITNDNDKHYNNIVINKDFSDFVAINGAVSFGNSLSGYKNTLQLDMHNMHMKLEIDQQTQIRLGNLSLKDYRAALGGNIEDWAVGQAFLRNRYLLYLQETEGEIDYEKFRTTIGTVDESDLFPNPGMWKGLPDDEFEYRKNRGLLPSQLFDSWSKGYLEQAAADPNHSDHADAKTLLELGVFMGPGFATNPEKYRQEGKHIEYANSIQANMDVPTVLRRDSNRLASSRGDGDDISFDPHAATLVSPSERK